MTIHRTSIKRGFEKTEIKSKHSTLPLRNQAVIGQKMIKLFLQDNLDLMNSKSINGAGIKCKREESFKNTGIHQFMIL
jgi:hypothetical protein